MKKRILGFAMAIMMCLGLTVTAFAAESPSTEVVLPITKVSWNENLKTGWDVTLEEVKGTADRSLYYMIEIFVNDQFITEFSTSYTSDKTNVPVYLSPYISVTGNYKVRVTSWMRDANGGFILGTPSETEERAYVRPNTALATTIGSWSAEKTGIFLAPAVEGAWAYQCSLYYVDGDNTQYCGMKEYGMDRDGSFKDSADNVYEIDFSSWMNKEGQYYAVIRALSGDVNTVANGDRGAASAILDTTKKTDEIGGVVGDANDFSDAAEGLDYIVDNTSKEDLEVAMQTNPAVREQIADLEEKYRSQNNITPEAPVVSEEAATYIKADEITMIGALLNAEAGDTVKLSVAKPEKVETLPGVYSNVVQLDLKLLCDNQSISELKIPITITMPIPTGVVVENLRIRHFHAGAVAGENVTYTVSADGKYITFTVDSFSTFVFANEIVEETPSNPGNTEIYDVVALSPKTGDCSMSWFAGLMVVIFGCIMMTKKKTY